MHGRAVPPAGRDLLGEFGTALGDFSWDVALLQEVPPWWPRRLADTLAAEPRLVLTSRNFGLPARRALATRWPDILKSSGGGCNAILVRRGGGAGPVVEHRARRLRLLPERRRLHAVRLAGGAWVGNLHLTVRDAQAALEEARLAAATARAWAAGAPLVLGGDFNVRGLALEGLACAANHDVDYVFAGGAARPAGPPAVLDRGRLSDHAPVAVTVALGQGTEEGQL